MEKKVVNRYDRYLNKIDVKNPLSVGNGDLAFTADITGTHTLFDLYEDIPLSIISNKLWIKKDVTEELKYDDVYGKKYMLYKKNQGDLFDKKRRYPHKFNLMHFIILYKGSKLDYSKIKSINQKLDLYEGILYSSFIYDGQNVNTKLFIFQDHDEIVFQMNSSTDFSLMLKPLYPSYEKKGYIDNNVDFKINKDSIYLRYDDENEYTLKYQSNEKLLQNGACIVINNASNLSLNIAIDEIKPGTLMDSFWNEDNGIIIDNDKLVERMVLSKYLLKVNSSGIYPPAESGLTYNNWNSKFHLEMHLIHSLWLIYNNHLNDFVKSLDYYDSIYNEALKRAELNGYKGIRFPKMTSPDGLDSPSNIGPLLIWQQPHIVFILQEIYFMYNKIDILQKYERIMSGVIDFMISFLTVSDDKVQMLDPILECSEHIPVEKCINSMFEIEYFRYVFKRQGQIDELLYGKQRHNYNFYVENLVKPKISNQIYLRSHGIIDDKDIYPDHPTEVFAYSYFKSDVIEDNIMNKTLDFCLEQLDLTTFWGWDFPFMGMCALKLGRVSESIEITTMESQNNMYLYNGHNTSPREDLKIYLPGNGAYLLYYNELSKIQNK